jgi:small-conductance mechanosensitive channel
MQPLGSILFPTSRTVYSARSPINQYAVVLLLAVAGFAGVWAQAATDTPQVPDGPAVIAYLNQAIDWHRHLMAQEQIATDPGEVLYVSDARQIGDQVLELAFEFAEADAAVLNKLKQGEPETAASDVQSVAQAAAASDREIRERTAQLQGLRMRLAGATGTRQRQLQAQIAALQSEIELDQARSDMLHSLHHFAGGKGPGKGDLLGEIEELKRSVPELESGANGKNAAAARTTATARLQPSGIIALVEELFALRRKMNTIDDSLKATDALDRQDDQLQQPLTDALMAMSKRGDEAMQAGTPADQKQQLDILTAQFKQLSAVAVPLGKQSVLFDSYRDDLKRWRQSLKAEYTLDLKRLALRLAVLGFVLAVLVGLAEVWRRAIFHYVKDVRHRYQFLLLRRLVIWVAIAIAIAFALASEIGSLATVIGLITAGIAVALQNVIMAIAGYFFLIGKYGVSVGDRVQIGGVTGDVLDIGLIRLHLMEVGSAETGRQPTGRVVVFSNAIVFQPGASFYKQIPGTNFAWHEVLLTLAPNTDYQVAEKRLMEAVDSVYATYRPHIESQHRRMQDKLNISVALPAPQSRLHFTDSGLKMIIRFPVELDKAAETDDEVTRKLLAALNQSPKLRLIGTGAPTIQPVEEPPRAKAS